MNTLETLADFKEREVDLRERLRITTDPDVVRAALRFVATQRRLLERRAGIGKGKL